MSKNKDGGWRYQAVYVERKTICFSKTIEMHDIVIVLVINILEFGLVFGNYFHAFCT